MDPESPPWGYFRDNPRPDPKKALHRPNVALHGAVCNHPRFGFKFLYPPNWNVAPVAPEMMGPTIGKLIDTGQASAHLCFPNSATEHGGMLSPSMHIFCTPFQPGQDALPGFWRTFLKQKLSQFEPGPAGERLIWDKFTMLITRQMAHCFHFAFMKVGEFWYAYGLHVVSNDRLLNLEITAAGMDVRRYDCEEVFKNALFSLELA